MTKYHVSYYVMRESGRGGYETGFGDMTFTPEQEDKPISRKDVQDMKNHVRDLNEKLGRPAFEIIIIHWQEVL